VSEQPLKLAFIAPGSLVHTTKWLNGLVNEKLEITLITQHKVTGFVDPRVTIKYLPYSGGKGYLLNAFALHREIKKLNPDVTNVHYASGYGTLALLANIKPYILSVWGSDVYEFPFQSKFKYWLINQSLKNANHIASTSFAMAEQVKKVIKQEQLPITITPFGVDLDRFYSTKQPFQSDSITIGIVKRLENKYGIDLLIKAFAQAKQYFQKNDPIIASKLKLTIVGDGSLENELTQLSDELNLQQCIEFVGAVDNSQVPKYINDMDIFVVPSRIESFGVAAIEALACERPCIVANTGGLPEVIEDKTTGIVADYESVESLTQAIVEMILQQEQAIEMGKQGKKSVLEKYTEQAAVVTMTNLYRTFYESTH